MKIEKLSENQIRCTLNKEDMVSRELRLSELAYGTEKARGLFRDMMQQASYEFGFEAEDIPLMIEAIPISMECLVLVVTKVDDPDELDTRFSKFSPEHNSEEHSLEDDEDGSFTDEIINCFDQLDQIVDKPEETEFIPLPETLENISTGKKESAKKKSSQITMKVYSFSSLSDITNLAAHMIAFYNGQNSVYKNAKTSVYYLVISKSEYTAEEFNKICNMISEYGKTAPASYATSTFFAEHYDCIVKDHALQILAAL